MRVKARLPGGEEGRPCKTQIPPSFSEFVPDVLVIRLPGAKGHFPAVPHFVLFAILEYK